MRLKRFVITAIVILIAPLTFVSCKSIINLGALSQPPDAPEVKTNQLLELTGTQEVETENLLTERGASFGTEDIQQLFQGAGWTFYPDGRFTFTPPSQLRVNTPISGTYVKVGNNFEFQAEQTSEANTISVDGTIRFNEENPVLDAIHINSDYRHQIVRISQVLAKGRSIGATEPVPSPENSAGTNGAEINDDLMREVEAFVRELEAIGIDDSTRELEAIGINDSVSEIEGIKIPNEFRISLEGKTDKGTFGPLPGTLFISQPDPESQNPLSVTLLTNLDLYGTNGWIGLISADSGQESPNIQIQANNGQVRLEFSPSEVANLTSYTYTLGPNESSPNFDRIVLIENGILTLTFEGEQIYGEIKASGIYFPGVDEYFSDFEQPSTYEAKLTGEIPKSPPVEKLKAALASSFNGEWNTDNSSFGQIKLQQNGQQVSGTYTGRGGGTIKGVAKGNRLDFTWQAHRQGEKGRGFFRAVAGGGTLVGITWTKENSASQIKGQSLIASWQIPSFITPETFSDFDLKELRYLGQELALQNRYEQAAPLLEQVIKFYLKQQQKHTQSFELANVEKEREQEGNIIITGIPLIHLIDCYFQLGDYEQLLNSLENYGLEILRLLGPEESASRLFRQRTVKIAEALASNAEQFEFMENGYRVWQQMVSGSIGVIGISMEQDETTQDVVVSSTEEGQPAELAGIQPQDVLVKINGETTQGMDGLQVSERLRGKPGTPVTITVRRGNQELEFQLERAKIELSGTQRQAELVEALTFFADSLSRLRETSKDNLYTINTLAEKIAQGQEEPVSALLSIPLDIEEQRIKLNEETNAMIAIGREAFSKNKEILQDLDYIFSKFKDTGGVDADIKELDAYEERIMQAIENSQDLSSIEKQIFIAYFTDAMFRLTFLFELKIHKQDIERYEVKKIFEENRIRSQEMTSSFADDLEKWRTRLVKDFDKIDALTQGQDFFQKAINFLISLGYEEEALVTSEKSRARALADLLQAQLSSSSKLLLNETSTANSPTIEEIKKIAKEQNATLVEYSIVPDEKLYIWVVKPTGQIVFKQVSSPIFGVGSQGLAEIIKKERLKEERLKLFYQLLIEPIADQLPTDPNAHVIFIPQGSLFYIPFPALKTPTGQYLIEKHTILTAPSIQVLELTHKHRERVSGLTNEVLVVGNPKPMPNISIERGKPPEPVLDPLENADKEAKEIANLLGTQPFIGKEATETTVVSQLPKAKIIHLATHGLLDGFYHDSKIPGAVALAPAGSDDGLLTADEIFNLELNAELVVLSACQTGLGEITGDGVVGLSRSFFKTGVPSVIVSLWEVQDESTAELMIEFYKNLQGTSDKAQALRQAMLKTMKKHHSPEAWAAFTLIGEAE